MKIERSSGNVFTDLDVPDAENMKLRVELSMAIEDIITAKGWNQREAAEHFSISPQRLNDILRGRVYRVTIDRLVKSTAW